MAPSCYYQKTLKGAIFMIQEVRGFLDTYVLRKRFNSQASKISFWEERNGKHLYQFLIDNYNHGVADIKCIVYNFLNNIESAPKCKMCDNITKFKSFKEGYLKHCCNSCLQKDPIVRTKVEATTIERYGVKSALCNSKEHMVAKYGVHNAAHLDGVNEKRKQTKLLKYGNENYTNSQKCRETKIENGTTEDIVMKAYAEEYLLKNGIDVMHKARLSFREQAGVDNPSQLQSIQETKKKNAFSKYGAHFQGKHLRENAYVKINDPAFLSQNSVRQIMETTGYSQAHVSKYLIKYNIVDKYRSSGERELANLIESFYNGEILTNKRSIIGRELDLYIPEYKFAIEYNGLYFHQDDKGKSHRQKFDLCISEGIYLLQIFEHEWADERLRKIYTSKIKMRLGIFDKIFARKCIIKEVSYNDAKEFLNNNHIDGNSRSDTRVGLYYQGELVSLMTFGKSRFKVGETELIRYASKLDTSVIGGASKLLKHYVKNTSIDNIVSFSNNLYSDGSLYINLGFKEGTTVTGYFYVNKRTKIKVNRMAFQKHKLKDIFSNYDESLTEKENVKNNGYFFIYDAGQTKWKLTFEEKV
jgi:hypothetical protein